MGTASMAVLAACASRPMPPDAPVPAVQPAPPPPVAGAAVPGAVAATPAAPLPPARSWDEYKLRVARRIVQTSGDETFSGPVPDRLQSIPVLQIQLNRDGSVRNIEVLRVPKFSPQTLQMAMKAIRRAGPFEPVGHLPRPWQYSETFLYNDDLKFQIRSLAEVQ
ncbi:MAG: hypothetical protein KIS62_11515 [Ramlibacter sp.]|nr:hypothetical protein [Ramlibacter sp.]MBX3659068.1 hypothetical protein [Ramlibacter sp.]MCW5650368.1 hypothetical protein [Ramlibacter sp.]